MRYPEEIVGEGWSGSHFPLLAKFLDASNMLPVHLHADDETAAAVYAEPNGKSEAWHILWADPNATILAGIKDGATDDELVAAFKRQDYDAVMPSHPIAPGDTVYVPGGILHSFGPNTLIFEIQQTSDLAQNVMPVDLLGNQYPEEQWDANIAQTLAELKRDYFPVPNPGLIVERGKNRYRYCCAGPYFALERWSLHEAHVEPAHLDRCLTISSVGDPVDIHYSGRRFPARPREVVRHSSRARGVFDRAAWHRRSDRLLRSRSGRRYRRPTRRCRVHQRTNSRARSRPRAVKTGNALAPGM